MYFNKLNNYKKGKTRGSGKNRLISINKPARKVNQTAAKTGAVERYAVKSCILNIFLPTCLE